MTQQAVQAALNVGFRHIDTAQVCDCECVCEFRCMCSFVPGIRKPVGMLECVCACV